MVPKEGVVKEEVDVFGRVIVEMPGTRKGPLKKVSASCFYHACKGVVAVRIEGCGGECSSKRK